MYITHRQTPRNHVTCECVMLHMWMHQVAHVNASYCTCEWVMSHKATGHIPHQQMPKNYLGRSYLTYQRVMSHTSTSHVSQINKSCLTIDRRRGIISTPFSAQFCDNSTSLALRSGKNEEGGGNKDGGREGKEHAMGKKKGRGEKGLNIGLSFDVYIVK